ncbi:MAG TPA: BACON domain-containing protein [Flavisolibacter sp.]|nr:BACON domain-containing protein [Flavisolibacter sp.]
MKNITKLLPVITVLLLWACSKPNPDTPDTQPDPPPSQTTPYLRASVSLLTVSGNAGKLDSFLIESNTKWSITVVSNSTDWVTVTPQSGTGNGKVYVSSKENNFPAVARTATAFINAENNATPNVRLSLTQGPFVAVDPPNLLWNKLYGGAGNDQGYFADATPDGGLIVVGNTNSMDGDIPTNSGGKDGVILKLTAAGTKQWVKMVGGAGDENLYGVTTTPDGGSLACGSTKGSSQSYSTPYLVRLDANGHLLWEKQIATSGQQAAMAITPAHDGGFLITGVTISNDVWIAKIDDNGNILWEKKYGGYGEEVGYAVVKSPGGGYVIAATSDSKNGDVTGAHGKRDAWVLKIDNTGIIEWKKTFGGSNDDEIWDVKVVPDGYVLAGFTSSDDGDVSGREGSVPNSWLVKLDRNGNLAWQKCVHKIPGTSVAVSPTGLHYFLVSGITVTQVDSQGNLVAEQVFGSGVSGNVMLYNILNVSATEYVVTGYTSKRDGNFSTNKGGEDIWVFKFKLPL